METCLREKVTELRLGAHSAFAHPDDCNPMLNARMGDELRLLVALCLGWVDIAWHDMDCPNNADWYANRPERKGDHWKKRVPYYSCNLDAMHEAELTLSEDGLVSDRERFRGKLMHVTHQSLNKCVHATAPQRAEAFVRTFEEP